MPGVVFWDVDTQHDFMKADGRLYVPDAESIIPNLARLSDYAHGRGIRVIASADDHVPGHRELSDTPDWTETFPPHCMRGTPGQRKIPETVLRDPLLIEPDPVDTAALRARVRGHKGDILFHKHWFDVFTNPNVGAVLDELAPDHIVLYGVATDVCDRYAIEGLLERRPGLRLTAVTDAMKAIRPDAGERLLADWRRRGVRLATTDDVVAGTAATSGAGPRT
jgi:nicotinamidase/pyrazinamidase